ncbi:MAG: YbaB/EbfC family nucleoid-associated protein [Elusimicrobiota bacterium]|jgi:DNA-binding protein YbaB|nr:YbaB/EbfC family nucleoid-associated protein [Elusimicrobiota bacterium]
MDIMKMAKDAMAMKSELKEMDKALKGCIVDVEYKGVEIKINAKNEVVGISLPEDLLKEDKEKIEKTLLNALIEASKKAQDAMAQEVKKRSAGMKMAGF